MHTCSSHSACVDSLSTGWYTPLCLHSGLLTCLDGLISLALMQATARASQMGIVGLPNVGKSTLFNVLTKMGIPSENFPFCTIERAQPRLPGWHANLLTW